MANPRDTMDSVIENGATRHRSGLLTSLPVVSRASRSVLPDEDEARTMAVTSGLRCLRLYDASSRHGLSLRTLVGLLVGQKVWYSNKCALIWKAKVTKSNRLLFHLWPSMRPIEETESGLLPTTQARDYKESYTDPEKAKAASKKRHSPGVGLTVLMLPTPSAGEGQRGRRSGAKRGFGADNNDLIHQTGTETGAKLRLQPAMTEWMMGFPEGWCDFPTEALSATPDGAKRRLKHMGTL
ncbi:MAG TPA: hypothetical protein VNG51_25000 [Ktedonobacteraceae bacterium]|nr:hypothetical protein [Ktedonobacteraceae bacterium]